jgi:hypothetical protein
VPTFFTTPLQLPAPQPQRGLVLTIVAVALVMLLGTTCWHWLGYV